MEAVPEEQGEGDIEMEELDEPIEMGRDANGDGISGDDESELTEEVEDEGEGEEEAEADVPHVVLGESEDDDGDPDDAEEDDIVQPAMRRCVFTPSATVCRNRAVRLKLTRQTSSDRQYIPLWLRFTFPSSAFIRSQAQGIILNTAKPLSQNGRHLEAGHRWRLWPTYSV